MKEVAREEKEEREVGKREVIATEDDRQSGLARGGGVAVAGVCLAKEDEGRERELVSVTEKERVSEIGEKTSKVKSEKKNL